MPIGYDHGTDFGDAVGLLQGKSMTAAQFAALSVTHPQTGQLLTGAAAFGTGYVTIDGVLSYSNGTTLTSVGGSVGSNIYALRELGSSLDLTGTNDMSSLLDTFIRQVKTAHGAAKIIWPTGRIAAVNMPMFSGISMEGVVPALESMGACPTLKSLPQVGTLFVGDTINPAFVANKVPGMKCSAVNSAGSLLFTSLAMDGVTPQAHQFIAGNKIVFNVLAGGSTPTNISQQGASYYVEIASPTTFYVSITSGGARVAAGGSLGSLFFYGIANAIGAVHYTSMGSIGHSSFLSVGTDNSEGIFNSVIEQIHLERNTSWCLDIINPQLIMVRDIWSNYGYRGIRWASQTNVCGGPGVCVQDNFNIVFPQDGVSAVDKMYGIFVEKTNPMGLLASLAGGLDNIEFRHYYIGAYGTKSTPKMYIGPVSFGTTGYPDGNVFNATAHGLSESQPITFSATGGGITAGTTYYAFQTEANWFRVKTTADGIDALDITGVIAPTASLTNRVSVTAGVWTYTAHGLTNGQPVYLSGSDYVGTGLPTNTTANRTYYAKVLTADTFELYNERALTTLIAANGGTSGILHTGVGDTIGVVTRSDTAGAVINKMKFINGEVDGEFNASHDFQGHSMTELITDWAGMSNGQSRHGTHNIILRDGTIRMQVRQGNLSIASDSSCSIEYIGRLNSLIQFKGLGPKILGNCIDRNELPMDIRAGGTVIKALPGSKLQYPLRLSNSYGVQFVSLPANPLRRTAATDKKYNSLDSDYAPSATDMECFCRLVTTAARSVLLPATSLLTPGTQVYVVNAAASIANVTVNRGVTTDFFSVNGGNPADISVTLTPGQAAIFICDNARAASENVNGSSEMVLTGSTWDVIRFAVV